MINTQLYIIFISALLFFTLSQAIHAQNENKKWALGYSGGVLVNPVLTSNPSDVSLGRGSSSFMITGEYCLPKKWNLQAGYFRTEVSYGDGDRTMEGLQLGTKKYFINPNFVIQPYASGGIQINWSDHIERTDFTYEDYTRKQWTKNPRVAFAPGIGADIYILSSVAFVIEYNFNMGINSKTTLEVSPRQNQSYTLKDKGMYHYLGLGVKVTFPFRITQNDGMNLINILSEMLFGELNRKYDRNQNW